MFWKILLTFDLRWHFSVQLLGHINAFLNVYHKHFSCSFSFQGSRSNIFSVIVLSILHLLHTIVVMIWVFNKLLLSLFSWSSYTTVLNSFNIFIFVSFLAFQSGLLHIESNSFLVLGCHGYHTFIYLKMFACTVDC
jgi:hypothetical protein